MSSHRHQRVQELLKRGIGEVLRHDLHSESVGLVTVNEVSVSGNLQSAVVFVSIVGSADQQARALSLLRRNRARIQGRLARAVTLKYTPRLRFLLDESVERGNRVLGILAELERSMPPG